MWRKITLGLLALTAVHAAAQEPASGRTIFRVGGFSARAGVDLPVGPRLAVSPFAGFLTMVGHDGPRVVTGLVVDPNDPGVRTRLSSLQIGAVLTFTP